MRIIVCRLSVKIKAFCQLCILWFQNSVLFHQSNSRVQPDEFQLKRVDLAIAGQQVLPVRREAEAAAAPAVALPGLVHPKCRALQAKGSRRS